MDTQQNAAHIRMIARDDNNNIPYPFLGLESYHTSYGYHWRVRACERGPEGSVFKERARANTTNPWVEDTEARTTNTPYHRTRATRSPFGGFPTSIPPASHYPTSARIVCTAMDAQSSDKFRGIGEAHSRTL
ncbi:hypothetical protein FRB93_006817 [Tulasnella sp. JGI-2019a]|nr:hypothetical protein FRB93_006817 [Tulasnella sp. JGI-2019a]